MPPPIASVKRRCYVFTVTDAKRVRRADAVAARAVRNPGVRHAEIERAGTMPAIGDKVWRFDQNRRVYARDENGKARGGPIWREHWEPLEIIGETTRSWIIGRHGASVQFGDKIAKAAWPGALALSEEDISKRAFVEGRYSLSERVRRCTDYETLKKIEAALDAAGT